MIDGKTLSDCFSIVSKCGAELESLCEVLNNSLSVELERRKNEIPCLWEEVDWDYRKDDSDWVYTDVYCCFPLKRKGKGKNPIESYLGYQISLYGDGIAIPGNFEPLIHVFQWNKFDFNDEEYLGFPWDEDEESPLHIVDKRLLVWGNPDSQSWLEREWTYSLRLIELNTPESLKKNIIQPAIALLKGASATEALPDNLTAVFLYPEKEKLLSIS